MLEEWWISERMAARSPEKVTLSKKPEKVIVPTLQVYRKKNGSGRGKSQWSMCGSEGEFSSLDYLVWRDRWWFSSKWARTLKARDTGVIFAVGHQLLYWNLLITPNLLVFYELCKDVSLCSLHLHHLHDGMYSPLHGAPTKMLNAHFHQMPPTDHLLNNGCIHRWLARARVISSHKRNKVGWPHSKLLKPSSWSY